MARRTYEQTCGLARALDLLGERWTLLIVRELMLGPKRFGALREALGGINANLLSERLRTLTGAGLIESVELPEPARVSAYALTPRGEDLREPLTSLALWGMALVEPETEQAAGYSARGSWLAMSRMAAAQRRGALQGLPAVRVNAKIEGEQIVLEADGHGGGSVRHGSHPDAPASLDCGLREFYELTAEDAAGRLDGADEGAVALLSALTPPAGSTSAAA